MIITISITLRVVDDVQDAVLAALGGLRAAVCTAEERVLPGRALAPSIISISSSISISSIKTIISIISIMNNTIITTISILLYIYIYVYIYIYTYIYIYIYIYVVLERRLSVPPLVPVSNWLLRRSMGNFRQKSRLGDSYDAYVYTYIYIYIYYIHIYIYIYI